ncbi:MAG: SIS domain-containing protein [Bacteroidetes bacterium]|nr:SIS domain-containing protein [Bacteroidota bacterium]
MNIPEIISESIEVKKRILEDQSLLELIQKAADVCVEAFISDKKVLFCGNGGSAADAQHLAAELSGKFYFDRKPLFTEALHVNTSYLTAVANDYSFEEVFSRLVVAKGRQGDVLVALSTSGNSPNILQALVTARKYGLITIGLTGGTGGKMKDLCDHCIIVPSADTPRIQECHIMIGHIICEIIESKLFSHDG